ncbi:WAS/WASL-interacting protein family member 3-like [Onychomys torridus]|uniref:WAS/WASL-interacting protein family member 3-like n=1 Tax=Onychomys torridus TaxID=38674 RepID=UPI00167F52C4|nr:WAS/WASL-interacting protein family member 3-like [Onychomys torridus]
MGDITPPASQWLGPTPPISRYYPQAPPPSPPPGQFAKMGGVVGGGGLEICYFFQKKSASAYSCACLQGGRRTERERPARTQGRGRWTYSGCRRAPTRAPRVGAAAARPAGPGRVAPCTRAIALRRCQAEGGASTPRGAVHVGSSFGPLSPPFLESGGRALPSPPRNPSAPAGFCPVPPPPPVFPPRSRATPNSARVTVCGDHRAWRLRSWFLVRKGVLGVRRDGSMGSPGIGIAARRPSPALYSTDLPQPLRPASSFHHPRPPPLQLGPETLALLPSTHLLGHLLF